MKPGDKVKYVGPAFYRRTPDEVYTIEDEMQGITGMFYCINGYWRPACDLQPVSVSASDSPGQSPAADNVWEKAFGAFPEPSKEALEIAKTAYETFGWSGVAAALQKLMDERDWHDKARYEESAAREAATQRAWAAEQALKQEEDECERWYKRAEAAEKALVEWKDTLNTGYKLRSAIAEARLAECEWERRALLDALEAEEKASERTEARLAELVRRVRERYRTPGLLAILDEYEAPK